MVIENGRSGANKGNKNKNISTKTNSNSKLNNKSNTVKSTAIAANANKDNKIIKSSTSATANSKSDQSTSKKKNGKNNGQASSSGGNAGAKPLISAKSSQKVGQSKATLGKSNVPGAKDKNKTENIVSLSNTGPKIQAQRKFAQAGNIYSGTLNFNSNTANSSPVGTPSKSKESTPLKRSYPGDGGATSSTKKIKKPTFSPPQNKKPKTEDFLTFLCFRGTPALPPELDYFNYPPIHEPDEISSSLSSKKKSATQNLFNVQSSDAFLRSFERNGSAFGDESKEPPSVANTELNKSNSNKTNSKEKDKDKEESKSSQKVVSNSKNDGSVKLGKSSSSTTNSLSNSSNKADNPTKGIRATASSVLFSKMKKPLSSQSVQSSNSTQKTTGSASVTSSSSIKKSTTTKPILSPARSRLNEQDARFAMTALKFQYQRLASSKLTKKAKERTGILTRSKARTVIPVGKLSPNRKPKLPIRAAVKSAIISPSRNAPSPDIILGVTSSAQKRQKARSPSRSSTESETKGKSSSEASEFSDDEEKASEDESEEEKKSTLNRRNLRAKKTEELPKVRSLRNGKELVTPTSSSAKKSTSVSSVGKKQDSSSSTKDKRKRDESSEEESHRRVGTRSAQRGNKSPLRELPMWNSKTGKQIKSKKKIPNNRKSSQKKEESSEEDDNEDSSLEDTKDKKKQTVGKKIGNKTKKNSSEEEDEKSSEDDKKAKKPMEKRRNSKKEQSSDEESSDETSKKLKKKQIKKEPISNEEESSEEITKKGRKKKVIKKGKGMKKEESSDEESSSKVSNKKVKTKKVFTRRGSKKQESSEEEEEDEGSSSEENKIQTKKNKMSAKKSKESSEEDSEDEKKVSKSKSKVQNKRPQKKNVKKEASEEDEEDESSDDENKSLKKKGSSKKQEKKTVKKNASEDESHSDEEAKRETRTRRILRGPQKNKQEKEPSGSRPSRKTKETASLFLGLYTKGFTTEEEDSEDERKKRGEGEDSEVGSSSSSETKFLEKHYNASLKRTQQNKTDQKKKKKSDIRTRSTKEKDQGRKKGKKETESEDEESEEDNIPTKRGAGKKSASEQNRPNVTRKQKEESNKKESSPAVATRTNRRQTTPTVGDRKMPGAARKSAAIVSRRRSRYSSASDENDEDSSRDEESPVEEQDSEPEPEKELKPKSTTSSSAQNKKPTASSSSIEKKSNAKKICEDETSKKAGKSSSIPSSNVGGLNLAEESKTIATEMRRLVEQKSSLSPASSSFSNRRREQSVETEQCKFSRDGSRSPVESSSSSSSSSSESEASEKELTPAEKKSSKVQTETVTIAIQCDMDLDEEAPKDPPVSSVRDNNKESSSSKQRPHRSQQEDDSDSDVQEIGQVFASTSTQSIHHPHPQTQQSFQHQPIHGHNIHTQNYATAPGPNSSIPSNSSSTSFLPANFLPQYSYTQPSINDPLTSSVLHNPATNPFLSSFYTPLQLTPPVHHHHHHLHQHQSVSSSIHLSLAPHQVQGLQTFHQPNHPLNTLSIPVSIPPHLPHQQHNFLAGPFGSSGLGSFHQSATATATMLHQTHIRSVATNLDIPLVRPPAYASAAAALTRPTMWASQLPVYQQQQQQHHQQHSTSSNYSAFRVPSHQGSSATVIHHQSTTVLGMNSSAPILPVSIVQPQQHSQQNSHGFHHPQQQQQQQQSQPMQNNQSQQQQKSSSSSSSSSKHSHKNHTSSQETLSSNPPGYNIIKNLPNVSIVPKFDRNAAKVSTSQLPSQEPGSSKKSNKKDKVDSKEKEPNSSNNGEPPQKKKPGRKKKDEALTLPKPTSPLTVRKDSNPATYSGTFVKKPNKSESGSEDKDKAVKDKDKSGEKSKGKKNNNKLEKKSESPGPSKQSFSGNSSGSSIGKTTPSGSKSSKSNRSSPFVAAEIKFQEPIADSRGIKEAPTFHPTDQEFENPLKYIQKIQGIAGKYGMARIVPPKSFRPECNVEDDMRFTAYNHYIHKMYQRWGPNVLESTGIKENLRNSQVDLDEVPLIGGMEINLSSLYQTVKSFGGLKDVIEKEKWTKVADAMHVPKAAHDRATKLDGIYVKYVLPYEILSDGERDKLKKKVEKSWAKRRERVLKAQENSEDEDEDSMDELDECIVKGKSTPLSAYYRVARNTMNIFFPTDKVHSTDEIEAEYWRLVKERNRHVCVYSGSIDCAGVGWGFPIPKSSNKHPWNLKVLANNQGSVLRSMGPVMGATVPTLHVSMLFTTYCWYRDPHSLPWAEYLHSGAKKVWYSVPLEEEKSFRSVLTELMPMQCKKKKIWLASDSAMVPPELLLEKGVPLVRAVQNPGEFLVVFPKVFTSAVCTGYLISESVCFAYPSWLGSCLNTFKDIQESKEPPVFPLEKLLLSILQDARASLEVVRTALPSTGEMIKKEVSMRKKLISLGLKYGGKITSAADSSPSGSKTTKKKRGAGGKARAEEEIEQCYQCNYLLWISMVRNNKTDSAMCLGHAIEHFARHKADVKKSTLLYDFDEAQLEEIVENAKDRCGNKMSPEK